MQFPRFPDRFHQSIVSRTPPLFSVKKNVRNNRCRSPRNTMRRNAKCMFDENPTLECMEQSGEPCKNNRERCHHHRIFNAGLPSLPQSAQAHIRQRPYRLFIPSAIEFQSSCKRGRKSAIAIIAMTTSTPTKIAYSVVPCPCSSSDPFRRRALERTPAKGAKAPHQSPTHTPRNLSGRFHSL